MRVFSFQISFGMFFVQLGIEVIEIYLEINKIIVDISIFIINDPKKAKLNLSVSLENPNFSKFSGFFP